VSGDPDDRTWRLVRVASNEASFRDINERLEQGMRQVRHAPDLVEFVCECGDRSCTARVRLTLDEYEAVRADSRRFVVVPGHVFPDVERAVAGNDRYEVAEKFGTSVELTDTSDRRAPGARGRRSPDAMPGPDAGDQH
jgi:hypothetical protein